ncbi:hypothetical protein Mapa_010723 [Marchantia paleacea]|nr:hypothetical protein Mapa_010723 [Marchantia paleacea]
MEIEQRAGELNSKLCEVARGGGMARTESPRALALLLLVVPFLLQASKAEDCGAAAGGALCPGDNCCSQYGFCGVGDNWCGDGCQSGPCYSGTPPSPPTAGGSCGDGAGGAVSASQFTSTFPSRNSFYTFGAFIDAANSFSGFGTAGDCTRRQREIAAFFAHVHHETGGLTKIVEDNPPVDYYCDPAVYPCAAGKQYYGRGPLQLSWNYNYKQCGDAIGIDLLNNPELVETDAVVSFKTAIWFWQTAQSPKPACHDVITGTWVPSADDIAAGRVAGFGETINIINGGLECGPSAPRPDQATSRVNLFTSICGTFGVSTGDNLSCSGMTPYG